MELIAEQGFSATTVDEIAARAGVAKGTVYYNFACKNVLFEELLRHGVGLLTADFRAAVAGRRAAARRSLALIRAELAFIERLPLLRPAAAVGDVAHQPRVAPDAAAAAQRGGRRHRRRAAPRREQYGTRPATTT